MPGKQRPQQDTSSFSGVGAMALGGLAGGMTDFGSNAAMAEQLNQQGPIQVDVLNAWEKPLPGQDADSMILDREWVGIVGRGKDVGISEGDKVDGAGETGVVDEVYKFRAKIRWYSRNIPPSVLTLHRGVRWSRAQAMAQVNARAKAAADQWREDDIESEYDSRR